MYEVSLKSSEEALFIGQIKNRHNWRSNGGSKRDEFKKKGDFQVMEAQSIHDKK